MEDDTKNSAVLIQKKIESAEKTASCVQKGERSLFKTVYNIYLFIKLSMLFSEFFQKNPGLPFEKANVRGPKKDHSVNLTKKPVALSLTAPGCPSQS